MRMTVTLHPPDASGAWRIHLTDPPSNLPTDFFVALDGRRRPFRAAPPTPPIHPINTLWSGASGTSQPILDAVRAVATGAMTPPQAEAIIAERLTVWSRNWAQIQAYIANHRW